VERAEIISWLEGRDDAALFARADAVRRRVWGDGVLMRGIVELSNHCVRNCLYCGLRRGNGRLTRFRLSADEVQRAAARVYADGIRTVVLQSGDDMELTCAWVAARVQDIKRAWPDMYVTLSLGERTDEEYRVWREAGAERYLIKHETADEELYQRLHPGQSFRRRMQILEVLRTLGYEVGTGCITGLPGQSMDALASDICFLQEWQPEMAGIGPFMPHGATPLGAVPAGSLELTLRVLALARIVAPRMRMPATTALGSLAPEDGLTRGLRAGCNVIMCDYTPESARALYSIYERKEVIMLSRAREAAAAAGRYVCVGGVGGEAPVAIGSGPARE